MLNTVITHFQIFAIGVTFGIAGPCFLACTPILITYVVGKKERWAEAFKDILIFLSGRLLAYILLGGLAGLSGAVLRRFTEVNFAGYLEPISGAVSIVLGIIILAHKEPATCACGDTRKKTYNFGGLFVLGFMIGVSPCAPLLALLFQIALMSKNALDGASYAFSFGLGTFLSGLIVVGTLTGILGGFTRKLVRSRTANIAFRIACGALLILLGLGLIFGRLR